MHLILQNPYSVIGELAGAGARAIAKKRSRITAFLDIGKDIEYETDLKMLGTIDRSQVAIDKAFSAINSDAGMVSNALFWFTAKEDSVDEVALNHLWSSDIVKAEEIWEKETRKGVSDRRLMSFNNLGTLKMVKAFSGGRLNLEQLVEGIRLKTELITATGFKDFCISVSSKAYTLDANAVLENMVTSILDLDQISPTDSKKLPMMLAYAHNALMEMVSEKLTDAPIENIEAKIEKTRNKRTSSPKDGTRLANFLHTDTKSDLSFLKDILGQSDMRYQRIADSLAKEILQCGIDYFLELREQESDHSGNLGADVMRIFKKTQTIAVGITVKDRINENISGLQEWIDNSAERRKQALIEKDLKFITNRIEQIQGIQEGWNPDLHNGLTLNSFSNVERIQQWMRECKPSLRNIKSALGQSDEFYLSLSSAFVQNVQNELVGIINAEQKSPLATLGLNDTLVTVIRLALQVMEELGEFDMASELRSSYRKNHKTLKSISSQLNRASGPRTGAGGSSGGSSGDGACYVATMAYGSYDHPQVMELRRFRDEVLKTSIAGRCFVKLYYAFSPKLVSMLQGHSKINENIRNLLNLFIRQLK